MWYIGGACSGDLALMTVNIKELRMRELILTIPDDALAAFAESPENAGAELRMLAAVKLLATVVADWASAGCRFSLSESLCLSKFAEHLK